MPAVLVEAASKGEPEEEDLFLARALLQTLAVGPSGRDAASAAARHERVLLEPWTLNPTRVRRSFFTGPGGRPVVRVLFQDPAVAPLFAPGAPSRSGRGTGSRALKACALGPKPNRSRESQGRG